MLNSLLKMAAEVGKTADELQAKDKTLTRVIAIQEALKIVKKKRGIDFDES